LTVGRWQIWPNTGAGATTRHMHFMWSGVVFACAIKLQCRNSHFHFLSALVVGWMFSICSLRIKAAGRKLLNITLSPMALK